MARPTLQVKGYTPEQIKSFFRDDERYTIGLRLYAVYQVSLGQSSRNLEELYNTNVKEFGLLWEDCEDIMQQLGFIIKVDVLKAA